MYQMEIFMVPVMKFLMVGSMLLLTTEDQTTQKGSAHISMGEWLYQTEEKLGTTTHQEMEES